jgi:hypothetical protein
MHSHIQSIGKYQLDGLLGQGGMGAVYRSFHPHLNRPVALKIIRSDAADAETTQRFLREAQVVAGLSHPNIINIFDIDVFDGQPYLVMELITGGSLAGLLAHGPLPSDDIIQLALPLTDALEYAHQQGIVHRDLKPANVLLRTDGSPVLADFGLAVPALADSSARLTATGAIVGTPAYMAPEQFTGAPCDSRTDVYALGAMLFEMLTGQLPFNGDIGQMLYGHLQVPPPHPGNLNSTVPEWLSQLVLRMLAKDPAARPQSAAEVGAAMRVSVNTQAATGQTVVLPSAAPPAFTQSTASTGPSDIPVQEGVPEDQPHKRQRQIIAGSVVAAILLMLLVGALFMFSRRAENTAGSGTTIVNPALFSTAERQQSAANAVPELTRVETAPLRNLQSAGPETFAVGNLSHAYIGNSLWFFGEVRNDGTTPRERVQIRVNVLDSAGSEIASEIGFATLPYLNPGEIAAFSVLFNKDEAPQSFDRFALEVRSSAADFELGYTLRTIKVTTQPPRAQYSGSSFEMDGKLQNTGEKEIRYPEVMAVFYNAQGNVVGLGSAYGEPDTGEILLPGHEARFELSWNIFTDTPTAYRVYAAGSRVTE